MDKICVIGICGQSVFLQCKELPKKGQSIECSNLHIEPGGKGVNVATTIRRLGGDVSYLVSLGNDDYAKKCIDFFKDEDLAVAYQLKSGTTDYGVIMHDEKGNNCVSVFMDDNVKLSRQDVESYEGELKDAKFVVVAAEVKDEVLLSIAEFCNKYDFKIIFDPSPVRDVPKSFMEKVWLFTPNETEYEKLFEKINPKKVVITLGDKGALLIEDEQRIQFPAVKVKVKNTTGAGDVFNGALSFSLANGNDLPTAVQFAMRAAAYKVSGEYVVKNIPTIAQLNDFNNSIMLYDTHTRRCDA